MHSLLLTAWINRIIPAFSWMLIHSLWQGLLLAIITGLVLMMTKKSSAAVRYSLVFVQFLVFLLSAACTFVYEYSHDITHTLLPLFPAPVSYNTGRQLIRTFSDYFTTNAPLIVMIWFIVFIFKSIRIIAAQVYARRIRSYQVYGPAEVWKQRLQVLANSLHLQKAVVLLESGYVKVPVVVGSLKPVILMPLGMLTGLPAAQVEAVLLHELAHIRRKDYFVNFLQTVAEAIFFFNPGLLWVSALLREERENCCDDIAIEQTGNKKDFVQALISFKEHALYGSAYATAFPGKKNHLLQRVMRIVSNKNKTLSIAESVFFAGSILVLSVMLAAAAAQSRVLKQADTITLIAPVVTDTVIVPAKSAKITITTTLAVGLPQSSREAEQLKKKQEQYQQQQRIYEEQQKKHEAKRREYEEEANKYQEQQRVYEAQAQKYEEQAKRYQQEAKSRTYNP